MNIKPAILFAALTLFAFPSFAQFYSEPTIMPIDEGGGSYTLGTYMENPCTATEDWVLVDYYVDLYQQYTQTASGTQRSVIDDSTSMGSTQYAAYGTATNDVAYNVPFTVRNYYKVNTYDNFHVVTVIDFDPGTRETIVSVETACGDGTPGSAQ